MVHIRALTLLITCRVRVVRPWSNYKTSRNLHIT
uniref:Uncharacterized protein n=1 Tax=Anguilla anguilla TaxID=7936 RepID=A0A0E9V3M6_ANGAN